MFAKTTCWRGAVRAAGSVGALFLLSIVGACAEDPVAPPARATEPREPHADIVGDGGPQIEAGGFFTCGIRTDARVLCWGLDFTGQLLVPTDFRAKGISAGPYHACGVSPTGMVTCWGARPTDPNYSWVDRGQAGVPRDLWGVTQVVTGQFFSCALRAGGTVVCWGDADEFGDVPTLSDVVELTAGANHACALKSDGSVTCWGDNSEGQASPPFFAPRMTQLTAGVDHTCGVTATGGVVCWGAGGAADVPDGLGSATMVAASSFTTCAVDNTGGVSCWGANNSGQASPPAGLVGVTQVTVGAEHACALKADLSTRCWGSNTWGQTSAPSLINRAPLVSFPTAGPWTEGAEATIPAWVVEPDVDPLTYSWTLDGQAVTQGKPGPTLTLTFIDDGTHVVSLTVSDGQLTATATRTVEIRNVAPRLTAINAPAAPVAAGTTINISGTFTDPGWNDIQMAYVSWGRGMPFVGGFASGSRQGAFYAPRSDLAAGLYQITVRVKDDGGMIADSTLSDLIVVYDPTAGYVAGKGAIVSPAGACQLTCYGAEGRASFGFTSRYDPGAATPTGSTQFVFKAGNLEFASTKYQWLVVSGARAQYKGDGTINGGGSYGFLLTAVDGDLPGGTGVDKFRIKIWDKASGLVVYDNQMGAAESAEPASAIASGSITIKK